MIDLQNLRQEGWGDAADEIERLRTALMNVQAWTCLQDDTIWYDTITTLHDHCALALNSEK